MALVLVSRRAAPALRAAAQQTRGMATEKQILMRINSTSNIAKITKSMKMVSTAKMRGADQRLTAGRPFASFLDRIGSKNRRVERDGLVPADELKDHRNVFVLVSSDRGLCGGVNSGLSKVIRKQLHDLPDAQLFIIGDKGRGQLRREFGKQYRGNITEAYATPPNFAVASAIAEAVLAGAPPPKAEGKADPEHVHIVFNTFVSAIAYNPSVRSLSITPDTEAFAKYDMEPDEQEQMLADLREFEAASGIYHAIVENMTSEESSRMAAMENATTNAEEIISSLTLVYNKARQSRITTELIEIISGAASLDDEDD